MKLFFVLAAASLLIVAAHATFLEGEGDNPMRSRCRQQMRMMEPQLEQCERYMTMRGIHGQGCGSEDSCMRQCCTAMKQMEEECACEWMKKMVEEQRGEMGEEDMSAMMHKMREMPSKCGMGHMRCDTGNNPMRSECRQQMRMMEPQLEQCEQYITMDMRPMGRTHGQGCRSEDSCMRQCCIAMKQMDEECACEWMKRMVEEQRGEMGEEDMSAMMHKMRQMPSKCGMGHMSCDMPGRRGYDSYE